MIWPTSSEPLDAVDGADLRELDVTCALSSDSSVLFLELAVSSDRKRDSKVPGFAVVVFARARADRVVGTERCWLRRPSCAPSYWPIASVRCISVSRVHHIGVGLVRARCGDHVRQLLDDVHVRHLDPTFRGSPRARRVEGHPAGLGAFDDLRDLHPTPFVPATASR